MSMIATAKRTRGTKRRCQSEACGLPFYDLNRSAFSCPMCGNAFDLAAALRAAAPIPARVPGRRNSRYFPHAPSLAELPESPVAVTDPDDVAEVEVEVEAADGSEIATVEPILADEDDSDDEIVDVIPEIDERPDE